MIEWPEGARGALQIACHLALGPFLRGWRTRWGASAEEIRRGLAGDEIVPRPTWSYNHAITVDAPRAAVWPWLVQLGQGRGGFYSYERLENLGTGGTTRLLERGRSTAGRGVLSKLLAGTYLIDPIGFVMSRKMLRTIKRLAERGKAAGRLVAGQSR